MSEGINYRVRYEGAKDVKEIETARYIKWKDNVLSVYFYPDVERYTPTHDLVNREENHIQIPRHRIIEVEEY